MLTVTEMLRKKGVVGKFVEFYGSGLGSLSLEDRATIGNMAPEYGATCGFFPVDDETVRYLAETARDKGRVKLVEAYAKAQGMWRKSSTPDPVFTVQARARSCQGRALARRPEAPAGSRGAFENQSRLCRRDGNRIQENRGCRQPLSRSRARNSTWATAMS